MHTVTYRASLQNLLRVEAMRARLEPGAGIACARARPASVASSGPVRGDWEAGFTASASDPGWVSELPQCYTAATAD